MDAIVGTVFVVIVLIFSVIIHEISHGFVALLFGDTTAKDAGRLTLNPMKHLDPFGSILLPILLAVLHAPVIGWARPVPYDPRRLKDPKRESGYIAASGPITNLFLAAIFAGIIRVIFYFMPAAISSPLTGLFDLVVIVNIALAIFNLIPLPPLDGSGILFSILPSSFIGLEFFLRRYGFWVLIFLIFSGLNFITPLISQLHDLFLGQSVLGALQ